MLSPPFEVIFSWPKSNYRNPTTRSNFELYFVNSIFLILATICMAFRLYSRLFIRRCFALDDAFLIIGYIFMIAVIAVVGVGYHSFHWNRHLWDVPPTMYSPALKLFYWARILWGQAAAFVRLSVICLYYRLLNSAHAPTHYYWVLHVNTIFNVGLQFYYLFTGLIPCWPIKAYWAFPTDEYAKCINDGASMQIAGVLNTFAEFVMALLPLIAVFRLHVDKKKRWSVIGLLSLGFLVSFVGIWRTFFIWRALDTYDLTWWLGPQWIASEIENSLALMCACAVSIRPLAHRIVGTMKRLKTTASTFTTDRNISGIFSATRSGTHHDNSSRASHSIDLEGFVVDKSFGYTVKISSHGQKSSLSRRKWGVPKIHKVGGKWVWASKESDSQTDFNIPVVTEVTITEDWGKC